MKNIRIYVLILVLALVCQGLFTRCETPEPPTTSQDYTLTLQADNPSCGTVIGGGVYKGGTNVEIKAIPANGYVFKRWSVDLGNDTYIERPDIDENPYNGDYVNSSIRSSALHAEDTLKNPRMVTVHTNATYTAYFEEIKRPYVILEAAGLMVQTSDLANNVSWSSADEMCKNSTVGGFTDWRLPTLAELYTLYSNRDKIGGFITSSDYYQYWSSTECNYYDSRYHSRVSFVTGQDYCRTESYYHYPVRAVRTYKK